MTATNAPTPETAPPKNRLILGGAIFVSGFLAPLLVPVVAATSWPTGWKATISGALILGIPELFMLLAAAVLGKAGFQYLKSKLFALFKRHAVPKTVGPTRYRFGLLLLVVAVGYGWVAPYIELIFDFETSTLFNVVTGDVGILLALFLLGGDFWDKIRALFLYGAKTVFPADVEPAGPMGDA